MLTLFEVEMLGSGHEMKHFLEEYFSERFHTFQKLPPSVSGVFVASTSSFIRALNPAAPFPGSVQVLGSDSVDVEN